MKRRYLPVLGVAALGLALGLVPGAAAADEDEQQKRANLLFEESAAAYKQGRFDEAITLLKRAYELNPDPVVFYNLARAYEGNGDVAEAAAAYEKYLAAVADIPDRGALTKKVESLKALAAEREKAKNAQTTPNDPVKPAPPPDTAKSSPSPSPAPWTIAGVGAAGLIAGGVIGALALSKNDEADTATSQQEAAELRSSAEGLALGSTVTLAIGGGILAAGVVWGIVDVVVLSKPSTATSEAASIVFTFTPSGAWLRASY